MDTYRINAADWTTILAAFATNQASYTAEAVWGTSKVDSTDVTLALEYMDYASCTHTAGVNECKMWQPDWTTDENGNTAVSDGYPRLGLDE